MAKDLVLQMHAPDTPLQPFVHSLWTLQGACEEAAPQRLVPDGCMSLVLNFGAPMVQRDAALAPLRRARTMLIGEVRRPVTLETAGEIDLLGVRFRPGAMHRFVDASMAQLVDGIADETALCGALSRAVERTVHAAERQDRLPLLQAGLIERLDGPRRVAGRDDDRVDAAVRALVTRDGDMRISALAGTVDLNRRSLERRFLAQVGIAPKQLARVLRFRRALQAAHAPRVDWAMLSADCGYVDQSHLIRDFKLFTGQSPAAWRGDEERALTELAIDAQR